MPPSLPRERRVDSLTALNARVEERSGELSLRVFVCGPNPTSVLTDEGRMAAEVRQYVSDKLEKIGYTVVWGEHRSFTEPTGLRQLKSFDDAAREILYANEEADCVIIFPASPGSFAELGGFGMHTNIPQKLLVIFNSRHKNGGGFLVGGIARTAKARNAKVWFRNYEKNISFSRPSRQISRK